jgi:hypothetical protein
MPRHHAGIFGVGGCPSGAPDVPPSAWLPHRVRLSHGPRAARTRQLALGRSVIASDSRPTPIETPILSRGSENPHLRKETGVEIIR